MELKFCPECGAQLLTQKFCQRCGANISKYLNAESSQGSSESLSGFDFTALENEASKQLREQEMLADFEIEDGVLKKYKGKGGKVVVPKIITVIGERAFEKNEDITEVVLPEGITEISDAAFGDARELKKINFPQSLRTIGRYAFGYTAIEEANLPEGIQVLQMRAFYGCSKLKKVSLPDSLKTIEEGVFGCTDKLLAIFIPKSVQTLGEIVFYQSNIVDLFFEADSLPRNVALRPEGYISGAWNDECHAAEHFSCRRDQVIIPDYDAQAKAYGSDLENYNKNDFEVYNRIAKCLREMSTVRFPYGTVVVTRFEMENSLGASTIVFPETTTVLKTAFTGWRGNYEKNTTLRTVYAESVVEVGNSAFQDCEGLTSFYHSDRLQCIDDCAFDGCTNLTNFTFPKILRKLGSGAFCGVPAIKNIKIPAGIGSIPSCVFAHCPNLETVEISEGITSIGSHAFCGCERLRKITIPGTVEKIGEYAFTSCINLETLEIAEGVKELGCASFSNCKKLKTVKIPYSMISICTSGRQSFDDCDNLEFVYIPRGRKDAFRNAFPFYFDESHLKFIEY